MSEFRDRNRAARRAALDIIMALAALLALIMLARAVRGEPTPSPVPTPAPTPAWIGWLDHKVTPGINYLGANPVYAAVFFILVAYLFYLALAVPVVWTLKVKYKNDRSQVKTFGMLLLWNILEFTALSPWIMIGRTARHYWPLPFKPWEPDTAEGKTPPPPEAPKP